MAFIKSKKLYAILMSSEEGKDIVQDAPDLSEEELQKRIDNFIGKSGGASMSNKEDEEPETNNAVKENNNDFENDKDIKELNDKIAKYHKMVEEGDEAMAIWENVYQNIKSYKEYQWAKKNFGENDKRTLDLKNKMKDASEKAKKDIDSLNEEKAKHILEREKEVEGE